MGVLKCEEDQNGRILPVLRHENIRKSYNSGESVFPADLRCPHCGECCMSSFEGTFIVAFGLNNSLKGENKAYNRQNIQLMFKMIDSTIKQMMPKVKAVYFIQAIKVDRPGWIHSKKCQYIFETVNKEVRSRSHSTISSSTAVKITLINLKIIFVKFKIY